MDADGHASGRSARRRLFVIGTTCGTGRTPATEIGAGKLLTELKATRAGSLDAVMAASHHGPFAVDLRRLSPADATSIRAVSQQRGPFYCDTNALHAFDVVVHLPHVNLAEPRPQRRRPRTRRHTTRLAPGETGSMSGPTNDAAHHGDCHDASRSARWTTSQPLDDLALVGAGLLYVTEGSIREWDRFYS